MEFLPRFQTMPAHAAYFLGSDSSVEELPFVSSELAEVEKNRDSEARL
jgi:hypothetical protein